MLSRPVHPPSSGALNAAPAPNSPGEQFSPDTAETCFSSSLLALLQQEAARPWVTSPTLTPLLAA